MKKLRLKLFATLLICLFFTINSWAQNTPVTPVTSGLIVPKGSVHGQNVERNTSNPEPITNNSEESSTFVSISSSTSFESTENPSEEISTEERIVFLSNQIESIEAKIFHLQEDEQSNAIEIAEKNARLQELQSELELLETK